jgi:hypothetical protein
VAAQLAEATNALRQAVPGDKPGALSFELVKLVTRQAGAAKSGEGSPKYTAAACDASVKIIRDAFAPLITETGEDMCGTAGEKSDLCALCAL